MKKLVEKIVAVDHHRNGISGTPFNIVIFESEGRRMLGIVLRKETDADLGNVNCFVLDVDKVADNNIRFGENSWRGDNYADELREAAEKWNQLSWQEKYPELVTE